MTPIDLFTPVDTQELSVLSFGAGTDSTYILEKLIEDKEYRKEYATNRLFVVMSDTGDEFEETYKHVKRTQQKCIENDI